MNYYDKAKALLDEDAVDFTGAVSAEEIRNAQEKLNVKFPMSYKAFLSDFGAGDVGGEVIFGIVQDKELDSEIDMVEITCTEYDNGLPEGMVIIYYDHCDENLYCLDTNRMKDDECPVVSIDEEYEVIEVIADSFGEFMYQLVYDEE